MSARDEICRDSKIGATAAVQQCETGVPLEEKCMKTLLCIAVLLASWSAGFAQDKVIDQATFDSVVERGIPTGKNLKGRSFRWTTTSEVKIEGKPSLDHFMKRVYESDTAGSQHSVMESRDGVKVSKTESFVVGDTIYSRIGDGEWTQKPRNAQASGTPPPEAVNESPFEVTEHNVEYKQASEVYNGRTVQTYLKTQKDKGVVKSSGNVWESTQTAKYWVNDEGFVVKQELRSLNKNAQQKQTIAILSSWDLDVDAHINAPR